jgi:putative ABC transport system substrate-binding protein
MTRSIGRRSFIVAVAGGVVTPLAAGAQPARDVRIGVVSPGGVVYGAMLDGLREGLKALGLESVTHGKLHVRETKGNLQAADTIGKDFERQGFTVIVTMGSSVTIRVKEATARIPIVFAAGSDPVELGIIGSLARPGGRLTGVHYVSGDLAPKRLQILRQFVPNARRVVVLPDPTNPVSVRALRSAREAASQLGITLVEWTATSPGDVRAALPKLTRPNVDGCVQIPNPTVTSHIDLIVRTANAQGVPTITQDREGAVAGALAAYGPSWRDVGRAAAKPLQRVIAGAHPGDIPVEALDRITLVVNAKTAKRLGITIPSSIMLRAEEMIEQ